MIPNKEFYFPIETLSIPRENLAGIQVACRMIEMEFYSNFVFQWNFRDIICIRLKNYVTLELVRKN